MKIKMHSAYKHFPDRKPEEGETYIDCYNDINVMTEDIAPNSIALLIEPRSIFPMVYDWMAIHYKEFKYVFTHDSILLNNCDNSKRILYGGGFGGISEYQITTKSKEISLCSSHKTLCELHYARTHLAEALKDSLVVDTMGTFDGGEYVSADKIYQDYRFSIVIENYIDDWWFTEKICNCFANKTIPIYVGARKIDKLFNPDGIIHCVNVPDVMSRIELIDPSSWRDIYRQKLGAVLDNYRLVKKYARFEDWFFAEYGELLEEMRSST